MRPCLKPPPLRPALRRTRLDSIVVTFPFAFISDPICQPHHLFLRQSSSSHYQYLYARQTGAAGLPQRRFATYQTANLGPQGGSNLPFNDEEDGESGEGKGKGKRDEKSEGWRGTAFKMGESALTTFASIAILG